MMFRVSDFAKYQPVVIFIEALNSIFENSNFEKLPELLARLCQLSDLEQYQIPMSYVFGVIAEQDITLLSDDVIERCAEWLQSSNVSVVLNASVVIGLYLSRMIQIPEKYNNLLSTFTTLLSHESVDIKDNILLFLEQIAESKDISPFFDTLLGATQGEQSENNISSLLGLLYHCNGIEFAQHRKMRALLLTLLRKRLHIYSGISQVFRKIIEKFFPLLAECDFQAIEVKELIEKLRNYMILHKAVYTPPDTLFEQELEDYYASIIDSVGIEKEENAISVPVRAKNNSSLSIYTAEKKPLIAFFSQENQIFPSQLSHQFSPVITSERELKYFIHRLLDLQHIMGYYSPLKVFYPEKYLKSLIQKKLRTVGAVKSTAFNYLPPDVLESVIKQVMADADDLLYRAKRNGVYYSSNYIHCKITQLARKHSSINLRPYKERLKRRDFNALVENLPQEYFTNYIRGTQYLTNIGKNRITEELEHSKLIGYYNISQISKKLSINKEIVKLVVEDYIDNRSGIFDNTRTVFYFTHYIRSKINNLNQTLNKEQQQAEIQSLALKLKIDKSYIVDTLQEHQRSIEQEIMKKDQISIKAYLDLLGMGYQEFMEFIKGLGVNYLKKEDILIFNSVKIERAKLRIKTTLVEQSRYVNRIVLTSQNFETNYKILHDLAQELYENKELQGFFYHTKKGTLFYTLKGIETLIRKNQFHISFRDLFPGKEFIPEESALVTATVKKLLKKKEIKGKYDEASLSFSSYDMLYARNRDDLVQGFVQLISEFFQECKTTYRRLTELLLNKDDMVRPQAISVIEKIITQMQSQFGYWGNEVNRYFYNANRRLPLIYPDKKRQEEMKKHRFENDPRIITLSTEISKWTKIINAFEVKYNSVIYLQKRLFKNPHNSKIQKELSEILMELKVI